MMLDKCFTLIDTEVLEKAVDWVLKVGHTHGVYKIYMYTKNVYWHLKSLLG